MGRGVGMVSGVGGDLVEEEDGKNWLVTMRSKGGMVPTGGGDFAEEEDGEGWLGTMLSITNVVLKVEQIEEYIFLLKCSLAC